MADSGLQHHMYEKLEHEIQLKNLVNPESLGNVVRQFAEFHSVRLIVIELDGSVLCGADDERPRLCRMKTPDVDDVNCPACQGDLPAFGSSTEKFVALTCASQVSYVRARVDNQFESAGHVILGPFVDGTASLELAKVPEPQRLEVEQTLAALPKLTVERATDIARLMCIVVEELVFANYQSYLFSKMHLQLSSENIGEVTSQGEDESYNQVLDSSEFSSLF